MLSRLTPPLNQHGFPVDAEKTGAGNTAGQGVLQKKKRPEISGLFVPLHVLLLPCRFVFFSPCSAAIRCVSSRPRSLFHAPAFPLLCALPSSPLFLLCAALPCAALFPLFFFPIPLFFFTLLFYYSSLTLSFSSLFSLSCPPPLSGYRLRALSSRVGGKEGIRTPETL